MKSVKKLSFPHELTGVNQSRQLTHHFYQEVSKVPKLGNLNPDDLIPAKKRLFSFLLQVAGGSQAYSIQRVHPCFTTRFFDWEIDETMLDHWPNSLLIQLENLGFDSNIRDQMMGYSFLAAIQMINHE